jgi:hypothetical protein
MNELATVTVRRTGREARADMVLVPVAEGAGRRVSRGFARALVSAVERRVRATGFRGGESEQLVVHGADATVVLLGMGKDVPTLTDWVRAAAGGGQVVRLESAGSASGLKCANGS